MGWLVSIVGIVAAAVVGVGIAQQPVMALTIALLVASLVLIGRTRRFQLSTSSPTPVVPELLLLPTAVGLGRPLLTLAATAGVAVIAFGRPIQAKSAGIAWLLPLGLLGASSVLVFWRGTALAGAATIGLAGLLLLRTAGRTPKAAALDSLMLGASLYLLLNVAGWMLGIQSAAVNTRIGGFDSSSALFGGERVFFPLARSINEVPIVSAVVIVFLATAWLTRRKLRRLHWLGGAAATFTMVAANSRTPVVIAVLVAVALLVLPRLAAYCLIPICLVALATPLNYAAFRPLAEALAGSVAKVFPYLERNQSESQLASINGREVIWTSANYWWSAQVSGAEKWFGFGKDGHVTSGAVALYNEQIGGFVNDYKAITMHSTFLQQLYDGGLVGLAALAVAIVWAMLRYRLADNLCAVAVLAVLALTAVTETSLTPGAAIVPFFLMLAIVAYSPPVSLGDLKARGLPRVPRSHDSRVVLPR